MRNDVRNISSFYLQPHLNVSSPPLPPNPRNYWTGHIHFIFFFGFVSYFRSYSSIILLPFGSLTSPLPHISPVPFIRGLVQPQYTIHTNMYSVRLYRLCLWAIWTTREMEIGFGWSWSRRGTANTGTEMGSVCES